MEINGAKQLFGSDCSFQCWLKFLLQFVIFFQLMLFYDKNDII